MAVNIFESEGWGDELTELLNQAGSLFFAFEAEGEQRLLAISGGVSEITGFEPHELTGQPMGELVVTEDWDDASEQLATGGLSGDIRVKRIDGSTVWLRANTRKVRRGDTYQMVGLAIVVDSLKRRESVLRSRLETDSLTGLYSREAFLERVMRQLDSNAEETVLGIVDLDSFKQVNDTLGHPVGDEVLRIVGGRLARLAIPGLTASRLGGDEFGLLISGQRTELELQHVAEVVLDRISESLIVGGIELCTRASIGLSRGSHGMTSAEMLRQADVAMYEAKGSNTKISTYSEATPERCSAEELASAARLRRSLEDELVMWFQPIIDLWTGETVGIEGLARWEHPDRGLLLPGAFLESVSLAGLNERLDLWAIESATRLGRMTTRSGDPLKISVNITAEGLRSLQLLPRLRRMFEAGDIRPEQLTLEISEQDIQHELSGSHEVLRELRAIGVDLSLDDFGTGYSSLTRLRDLPLTEVKMDRSFVQNVHANDADREIVRSTIEMGRALGLRVVAEGVEEHATSQMVSGLGCTHGQGNFYAHPMSALDLLGRQIVLPANLLPAGT